MKKPWIALSLMASLAAWGQMTPVGVWHTIDDETKTEKSLVRIVDNAGVLSGKIDAGSTLKVNAPGGTVHIGGKVECPTCHGLTGTSERPVKMVEGYRNYMEWCIECHEKREVSTDCYTCHSS